MNRQLDLVAYLLGTIGWSPTELFAMILRRDRSTSYQEIVSACDCVLGILRRDGEDPAQIDTIERLSKIVSGVHHG